MSEDVASLALRVDSKEVKSGSTDLDKLSRSATGAQSSFSNLQKGVALLGGALAAAKIGQILSDAATATKEFELSVSQLSSITGATGKDLEYLVGQSKEIGASTTLSASQAATAFKLIASAKPDLLESGEALNSVTRSAVTLAEAAGIDLPEAAQALAGSMNQFGAGAEDATRFINVLAAGSLRGSSAIQDTAAAMDKSGAAAHALGLSYEETNAAIQTLAIGNIKGSEAGTGLRNVLLALESETDTKLRPSLVGAAGAIENLAAMGLSATEMMDMFGKENMISAQIMVDNAGAMKQLEVALTGTDIAFQQAATNTDNWASAIKANDSAIEALQLTMGDLFLPTMRGVTEQSTAMILSVNSWMAEGGIEDVKDGVTLLGLALTGAMIPAIAASTGAFATGISSAFSYQMALASMSGVSRTAAASQLALSSSVGAFRGALALVGGPIGAIVLALGTLAIAYKRVQDAQEGARQGAVKWISSTGGLNEINLAIRGTEQRIGELSAAYKELEEDESRNFTMKSRRNMAAITVEVQNLEKYLSDLRNEQRQLIDSQAYLSEGMEGFVGPIRNVVTELDVLSEATINAAVQDEKIKENIDNVIYGLEQELIALSLTGLELELFKTTSEFLTVATGEQLVAIVESTTAIYEKKAALQAAEQATRDEALAVRESEEAARDAARANEALGKAAQKSAEESAKEWRRTRDAFADFFVDLQKNGGNAFDNLAKAFGQTLERMVSQWLASGLMNILGGNSFGTNNSLLSTVVGGMNLTGGGGGGNGSLLATGVGMMGNAGTLLKSVFGMGGNSMVAPSTAASGLMNGIGSFVTSPAGIAAIALIAGKIIHDKTKNPDGYTRSNAGFFTAPTPGAEPSDTFSVDAFASGFKPVGYALRSTIAEATGVIDFYRGLDKTVVDKVNALGGFVDMSRATLAGVNSDGQAGTSGTFIGLGGKSSEADLSAMANLYTSQLVNHIEGLSPEIMARLSGANSAGELIDTLQEIINSNDVSDEAKSDNTESIALNTGTTEKNTAATIALIESNLALASSNSAAPSAASNASMSALAPTQAQIDDLRNARVDRNLERAAAGYDFVTGTWNNKPAPLSLNSSGPFVGPIQGSHAGGLRRVPYDGYMMMAHKDEEVLRAGDPRNSNNDSGGEITSMDDPRVLLHIMESTMADMNRMMKDWQVNGLLTRT